jgi:hypothetical protein
VATPRTSRLPSSFTATATITARLTILPPSRTLRWVASRQGQGRAPSSGRDRKAFTRTSISAQSRLARLFDMPPAPMAFTRSSTARVETPCAQAS